MTWEALEDGRSPYVHWFTEKQQLLVGSPPDMKPEVFRRSLFDVAKVSNSLLDEFIKSPFSDQQFTSQDAKQSYREVLEQHVGEKGLPFFVGSVDPELGPNQTIDIGAPKLPDEETMKALAEKISENAVLTAVIDIGISPVHHRFRHKKDTTRVLSSWQQAGQYEDSPGLVSFGSELLKEDIDDALRDPSFDEAQFFEKNGLVRPKEPFGARDLDFRYSHGTHMADLACGNEPGEDDNRVIRPILAVNMPSKYAIGSAGTYLTAFALAALIRVVKFADALWQHMESDTSDRRATSKWKDLGGFPLVVNFSFGMQAGSKDGNGWLEALMNRIIEERQAPLDICVPAGNDNLNRASARGEINSDHTSHSFCWRIPPEDRSSNFIEMWTEPLNEDRSDLQFKIVAPDGTAEGWFTFATATAGHPSNEYKELRKFGQSMTLYRTKLPSLEVNGKARFRYRVVIAMLPTDPEAALAGGPSPVAQSGVWKIEVQTNDPTKVAANGDEVDIFLYIQSDQDIRPGRDRPSLRSYFDHEIYDSHTLAIDPLIGVPIGMPRDSYHVVLDDPSKSWRLDDWRYEGPIQRKGSQNALATSSALFVAGAYRLSDERPSAYSSTAPTERAYDQPSKTGSSNSEPDEKSPSGITALLPGDDGPMHPGLLGAGSKSGSVVALQGTSGAAALATRKMVANWAKLSSAKDARGAETGLAKLITDALSEHSDLQRDRAKYSRLKSGAGVIPSDYYTKALRHRPGWPDPPDT